VCEVKIEDDYSDNVLEYVARPYEISFDSSLKDNFMWRKPTEEELLTIKEKIDIYNKYIAEGLDGYEVKKKIVQDEILDLLKENSSEKFTIVDMQRKSFVLSQYSNQRLTAYAIKLVEEEILTKSIEKKSAYFQYNNMKSK
jgi:hypothetical protein